MNALSQPAPAVGTQATAVASEPSARRTRSRRVGPVLLALAVAASVLALAPSPAQGAAAQVEPPVRLSGATRYETAVKIAEAYVAEVEATSGRTVDTVILTSGRDEHFGYALPTPALARLHNAPVLLTQPTALPSAVTTFLTRPGITTVYIVGDTSVVSAGVQRDVDAISGITVRRVADADTAYGAAVAIAKLVGRRPGSPGEIRGHGRTALLATGENFADALAVGPLAYRGEHPILLTPQSALPAEVSTFLRDSQTEHVIILGGGNAVSAGIESDVKRLRITVERWRGSDRFGTALDIAEELLGLDTPQECFDGSGNLGLAYAWRSPDAIVSGPLLGEQCAALLLTERQVLPTAVENFLESDDYVTGDTDGKLRFTVFGGTAAVANGVVDDATEAASLVTLGATFEAVEGACQFTVTFAEPVVSADARVAANYLYGNVPFSDAQIKGLIDVGLGTSTTKAVVTLVGASTPSGAAVPTGCTTPLSVRDRIGIVGDKIKAAADKRRIGRIEFFVADDLTPPMLTMNATEGSSTVWIESSEPLEASVGNSVLVTFKRTGFGAQTVDVALTAGVTRFQVDSLPSSVATGLKIGDSVSIAADQVRDLAGNANAALRNIVARDTALPRVSQVTVTAPQPVDLASVTLNGSDGTPPASPAMRITARAGTTVDGAAGNDWSVDLDVRSSRPSSWLATQRASVQVSAVNRRIAVIALSAGVSSATVNDVISVLNANRAFSSLFTAALSGTGSDSPVDTGGPVKLTGGASTVDLTLEWTEAVHDCTSPDVGEPDRRPRVRLIEIDADGDGTTDFDLDGFRFGSSDVTFVDGDSDSIEPLKANCDSTTPGARPGTLVARLQSASLDNLPSTLSTAVVRAGAVVDLAGNANARQVGVRLQRP